MNKKIKASYSLLILWLLLAVIVGVQGEFPLNDDWCFAYPVMTLFEYNSYEMSWPVTSTLVLQVLWGYLFCWISGEFSFTALRISTLVFTYIGSIGMYQVIYTLTQSKNKSILTTLLLLFSPLYFGMCFTFMTDIPFFALVIWSIYFFLNYLILNEKQHFFVAIFLAILAFFIRQPGVLLLLAYAFILAYKKRFSFKNLLEIGLLIVAIIACFYSLESWIKPSLNIDKDYIPITESYFGKLLNTPIQFATDLFRRGLKSLIYLGFFLLPVWPFLDEKKKTILHNYKLWLVIIMLNIGLLIGLHTIGKIFPFSGNIVNNFGIGPILLGDTHTLDLKNYFELPLWLMYVFTFIGSMSFSFLSIFLWNNCQKLSKIQQLFLLFLVVFNVIYLGAMSIIGYFDRYLIITIASCLMALSLFIPTIKLTKYTLIKFLPLLLFAWFSISGTKDYMNWNTARMHAKNHLLAQNIPWTKIDAGFEWNGWYHYRRDYEVVKGKSFWWVDDPQYMLTFGPIEGYEIEEQFPYYSHLEFKERFIYVLKRIENRGEN